MTKTEAKKFRKRWEMVNAAEREELRKTPAEVKFRQLEALMASVDQLGWADALAAEEESVRARWQKLKAAYQTRKK